MRTNQVRRGSEGYLHIMSTTPSDSRYIPFTQQPSCCVPTCIQMVMYRQGISLLPAEEIGHHLGLVAPPDRSRLFYGSVPTEPLAGFPLGGIRSHLPEYHPNAAFARLGIPLHFAVEPIAGFSSAHELLERLRALEADDGDAILPWNIGVLLDDPSQDFAHTTVFDRVIGERVRIIDPSWKAPKWSSFDAERMFAAMQRHHPDWAGIWVLSRTDERA